MTKYYKIPFDLYVPVEGMTLSKRLAEELFTRALEENLIKGQQIKVLNTVIVDEK
jgi:hypothetical protein